MADQNRQSSLPEWTRYDSEDFVYRLAVMVDELGQAHTTQNKYMQEDKLEAECLSWLRSLEHIATEQLGPLMRRAQDSWKENTPMVIGHVRRVWDEIRAETLAPYLLAPAEPERARDEDAAESNDEWEVVDEMLPQEWNAWFGIPANWRATEPYPEGSRLYKKEGEALNAFHMREFLNSPLVPRNFIRPRNWWAPRNSKAPWEMMPTKDHPLVTRFWVARNQSDPHGHVKRNRVWVEFTRWVDRCTEIDFGPDVECKGYVLEHYGPEGKWEKPHACPMHQDRLVALRTIK